MSNHTEAPPSRVGRTTTTTTRATTTTMVWHAPGESTTTTPTKVDSTSTTPSRRSKYTKQEQLQHPPSWTNVPESAQPNQQPQKDKGMQPVSSVSQQQHEQERVLCHICGDTFTVHAIGLHIPKCQREWKQEQKQAVQEGRQVRRQPVPKLGNKRSTNKQLRSVHERNQAAQQVYQQHQQQQALTCRPCTSPTTREEPAAGGTDSTLRSVTSSTNSRRKKKGGSVVPYRHVGVHEAHNTVLCHICGRKYTIHSIDLHIKQCEKLWNQRQALLPPKQRKPVPKLSLVATTTTSNPNNNSVASSSHPLASTTKSRSWRRRRGPPQPSSGNVVDSTTRGAGPPGMTRALSTRQIKKLPLEERNALAMQIYNAHALEECPHCHRTFLPDRLQVHLPSCARAHGQEGPSPPHCTPVAAATAASPRPRPEHASNTVICHICGRKYTTHSIDIHIPQCQKLWKQRQLQLPSRQRRPVPQLPSERSWRRQKQQQQQPMSSGTAATTSVRGRSKRQLLTLEERNEMALQVYNDHALEKCQFCHRTFLPDRLQVHLPSCARSHGQEWPPRSTKTPTTTLPKLDQASNTVICHICGRKYTTHSIGIHIPQCEQLWKDRQRRLPSAQRKPLPRLPSRRKWNTFVSRTQGSKEDNIDEAPQTSTMTESATKSSSRRGRSNKTKSLNKFAKNSLQLRNEVAMQVYNKHALEKCQYCERTFLPDRLQVHLRSCAPAHGHDPPPIGGDYCQPVVPPPRTTTVSEESKNIVLCHICGRKYTIHSIDKFHIPQCEKAWKQRQAKLVSRRSQRKPVPQLPPHCPASQRNVLARQVFEQHALEACQYCGRTFMPDRLAVHLKSCERNHPKGRVPPPTTRRTGAVRQ